ncbi:MAG: DUF1566 domain-containing protein [Xanthomonadales bacterium]|nr:hypothetical protein [Xanthomonadales bacterium]MCC6593981.1 DUF1566 domain-containing protein [Xanthomonadales bacterium]
MRISIRFLAFALANAPAGAAPLNDSGQITCYGAAGAVGTVSPVMPNPSPASHAGQDCTHGRAAADALGALARIGAGVHGFDYTKIANDGRELPVDAPLGSGPADWACTRDNRTGLLWEVKTSSGARRVDFSYTWFDTDPERNGGVAGSTGSETCGGSLPFGACNTSAFVQAVNQSALCGQVDWRMPRLAELQSIADYERGSPPYEDPQFFAESAPTTYWSGQNYAGNPQVAHVFRADPNVDRAETKTSPHPVRLVRGTLPPAGGACVPGNSRIAPDARYLDHADGTVSDLQTGLMWKRCAEGQSGTQCSGIANQYTEWHQALAAARGQSFAGHQDWRLPNVKELQSLAETACTDPSINSNRFPGTPASHFWTSTAVSATGAQAWLVRFDDAGIVGDDESNDHGHVRLVRAGTGQDGFDSADPVLADGFEDSAGR